MKVNIEIYPKEIKKLLELLDLIDKKPEYIYKGDSSKSQEPIPIGNREVKKSAEPFSRKISDKPCENVKYNEKESLPNKEIDQSVKDELEEILNDKLSKNLGKWIAEEEELDKFKGKIKQWLKENDDKDESENINDDDLLNIKSNILDDVDKDKLEELIEACKQELEERYSEPDENDKNTKDEDSSTIKSDIPFHDGVSNTDENESEQFKNDLEKLFDEVFGTDNTND